MARFVKITDTMGDDKVTTVVYDEDTGALIKVTLPNLTVTTLAYDDLGRLTELVNAKTLGGEVINSFEYTYKNNGIHTGLGQVERIDFEDGRYATFTYDALERLTTEHCRAEDATTLFRHDYTYDDDGNRYRKEYNGDSELRVYYSDETGSTSDGEDTNLAPSNRVVRAWTRTGETGPTTTPNRYNVTGSYTEAHMDTIVVEPNDDAEKQVTATYHDDGFWIARNVELDDSDANTLEATITDLAGRSATCPAEGTHPVKLDRNLDVSYEYDAAGNVTKKTQVERYDNKAPTSTTYVTRYWYDDANRLRYIDYDWTTTEDVHYVYGPTGERVEVRYGQIARDGDTFTSFTPAAGTARGFVCLGGVVLEEWTVSDGATGSHTDDSLDTLVHRYVRNPATDLGGGIASIIYQLDGSDYRYYHYNHKGDTAALTDEDGKIIAWYEYDAWGAPVTTWHASGVENDFRFSTKQWDATPSGPADAGLIYFGARYYDPALAKWTQMDPAGTVDGLNLYIYAGNRPNTLTDPTGLQIDDAASQLIQHPNVFIEYAKEHCEFMRVFYLECMIRREKNPDESPCWRNWEKATFFGKFYWFKKCGDIDSVFCVEEARRLYYDWIQPPWAPYRIIIPGMEHCYCDQTGAHVRF